MWLRQPVGWRRERDAKRRRALAAANQRPVVRSPALALCLSHFRAPSLTLSSFLFFASLPLLCQCVATVKTAAAAARQRSERRGPKVGLELPEGGGALSCDSVPSQPSKPGHLCHILAARFKAPPCAVGRQRRLVGDGEKHSKNETTHRRIDRMIDSCIDRRLTEHLLR